MIIIPPQYIKEDKQSAEPLEEQLEYVGPIASMSHHYPTVPTDGLQLDESQYLIDPDYYWYSANCESFEELIKTKK